MKKSLLIALILGIAALLGYVAAMDGRPVVSDAPHSQASCSKPVGQDDMVWIEGGYFTKGAAEFYPEEGPPQEMEVAGFWIDRFEVTNARFGEFVSATGYVTVAERQAGPE